MRRPHRTLLFVLLAFPAAVSAQESTCYRTGRTAADSLAKIHLASTRLTAYQARALRTLDSLHRALCGTAPPPSDSEPPARVDTVVTPPPRDTTPTQLPPVASGVASLPRAVPVVPTAVYTAPCTQSVVAQALQVAVNQSHAGDVLCLAPGAVFRGTLTLPARGDAGWVVIRTAPTAGQPAPGERVRPSQRASLATIEAQGTNSAIVTAPGARGWVLLLLEVTTDSSLASWTNALVELATPPSLALMAQDIAFDRVWAHGWAHRPLRRCFALQSGATQIVNSWIDDCHEKGADSQAIVSWSGTGPFLIENNYLAGAGENILFGGATARFAGTRPSDITIRRNHIATPRAWAGQWTKKQLIESKNSARVLVEDNVLEGSWKDGQDGYALTVKSANGGVAAFSWASSSDWTIRRNVFRCVGSWIAIAGQEGGNPGIDSLARRVDISDNLVDSLGTAACPGTARLLQFLNNASHVHVGENDVRNSPALNSAIETGAATRAAVSWLSFGDARLPRGKYGINGCAASAWSTCLPNVSWGGLTLVGVPMGAYPGVAQALALDAVGAAQQSAAHARAIAATAGVVVDP